jgi:hypothetical protein
MQFVDVLIKRSKLKGGNVRYKVLRSNLLLNLIREHG